MKTSIKTLIASSLTAIVLSTAVLSANASAIEKLPVKESSIGQIRRVCIKGNVEVKIVQAYKQSVSYADDNTGNAKIIQDGDQLKITSADNNLVKLVVYVNQIYRIEAAENAIVKTEGKLKTQFLQIFLKGNAHADIHTNTEGLYTVINDNADLKLSGSTDQHTLVMGKFQKLTMDKFAALKTNISQTEITAVEKEIASIY